MSETTLLEKEIVIDEEKVESLKKEIETKAAELSKKVYAVGFNKDELQIFEDFINGVQWKGKEALGILEICKKIDSIKNEGIKNGAVFFTALEIEASHYFLNKYENKGKDSASDFIRIFKALEQSLSGVHSDNRDYEGLKKELAAAEQGLTTA